MVRIKDVAPTVIDALKTVEQGCRKIQEDTQFSPMMSTFMEIENGICFGCLATCTLMKLTGKTATELIPHFPPESIKASNDPAGRRDAFGFESDTVDFQRFEYAIDSLRDNELYPLLSYYGLFAHENALEAITWLTEHHKETLTDPSTKDDLRRYADFLHDVFIPKIESWFAA